MTDETLLNLANDLIEAERERQKTIWSEIHDRRHGSLRLHFAALAYLNNDKSFWPFLAEEFKPRGPVSDLVRSGALSLAALDANTSTAQREEYLDTLRRSTLKLAEVLEDVDRFGLLKV